MQRVTIRVRTKLTKDFLKKRGEKSAGNGGGEKWNNGTGETLQKAKAGWGLSNELRRPDRREKSGQEKKTGSGVGQRKKPGPLQKAAIEPKKGK